MFEPVEDPKSARFRAVAMAVCQVLLQRSPSEVKVTGIARSSGVSRAWLYKHFGSKTSSMLDFAVREIADAFAALEHPRDRSSVAAWKESLAASHRKGLTDVLEAPWALQIYMRYRHAHGAVGEAMRVIEARYVDGFIDDLPEGLSVSRREARAFAVLFTNTRMNLLHCWPEERLRRDVTEEQAIAHLLDIVDGWLARVG